MARGEREINSDHTCSNFELWRLESPLASFAVHCLDFSNSPINLMCQSPSTLIQSWAAPSIILAVFKEEEKATLFCTVIARCRTSRRSVWPRGIPGPGIYIVACAIIHVPCAIKYLCRWRSQPETFSMPACKILFILRFQLCNTRYLCAS